MELMVRVVPRVQDGDVIEYGGGESYAEKFATRVKDLGAAVRDVSRRMASEIQQLDTESSSGWPLDEITMKFSLDLEAQAGVVLATAKTTAGFEVSLKWKRDDQTSS